MIQFDSYFSDGLVQPPTRYDEHSIFVIAVLKNIPSCASCVKSEMPRCQVLKVVVYVQYHFSQIMLRLCFLFLGNFWMALFMLTCHIHVNTSIYLHICICVCTWKCTYTNIIYIYVYIVFFLVIYIFPT